MSDIHNEPDPDVAGYLLGTLEPDEAVAFGAHLSGCGACRDEVAQLGGISSLLVELAATDLAADLLPPGLEDLTFAAIEAAAQLVGKRAAPPPASASPPTQPAHGDSPPMPDTVIPITAARRSRRRPAVWLLTAAAAIVVAVAVSVGVIASRRSAPTPPLAVVRLVSAKGGPAHGQAIIRATSSGLSIALTVDDLPASPPGRFYTCWLVGPGDTLAKPNRVSVGSFVVRGPGEVHLQWDTAADLASFPTLGVTSEPDNGNPAHQGPKVLVTA